MTAQELDRLRDLIERLCGIRFDTSKVYLLEMRLRPFMNTIGCSSYTELCDAVEHGPIELGRRLVDRVVIDETYWFRDRAFCQALRSRALPELVCAALREGRNHLSVWSGACSTGQEPYSVAILAAEMARAGELRGFQPGAVRLLASDICRSALALAEAARYDPFAMRRGMADESLRERWFDRDGEASVVKPEIRATVSFRRHNLLEPPPFGDFDLVLVRNVLLYFSDAARRVALEHIERTLRPGGLLAVGGAEILEGFTERFKRIEPQAPIYRRAPLQRTEEMSL